MKISADKNFLEFNLENGFRYQERGNMMDTSTEFIRLGFKNFKKLFDLSVLQKQTTNDSVFRNNFKMLSARQLDKNIDSLVKLEDSLSKRLGKTLATHLHYTNIPETTWRNARKDTSSLPPKQTDP